MRNPPWHRDEIILALDLYFHLVLGEIHARNPAIIALSDVLNNLPIFKIRPDEVKFRNPNGVALKLSNFLALDPNYHGKGMQAFSRLDEKVFWEFLEQKQLLGKLASAIKSAVQNKELNEQLYTIEEDVQQYEVMEGQVIYRLHKHFERNAQIIKKKKTSELALKGVLECEACTFNFGKGYGKRGEGFIECHHRIPLFELNASAKTTIADLSLVCSNCHRMLHRGSKVLLVDDLKDDLKVTGLKYYFGKS